MKHTSLVLIVALTVACSLPLKERVVTTYQAGASTLQSIQQTERTICNPAIVAPAPVTACAGPAAEAAKLTTERHRAFAAAVSKAAGLGITAGDALKAWKAGDPVPQSFTDYVAAINAVLAEVQTLTPTQPKVQQLATQIQQLVADLAKVRADLTKS